MQPGLVLSRALIRRGGTAAIEFAIVAPVLVLIMAAAIELGLAVRDANRAQQAAAAGADYASGHGWDPAGISAAVTSGSNAPGLTASPAPALFCGCPQASGVASATCGGLCPDGTSVRQYVRVSASVTRTSVLKAGLPLPAVLTRQSIARLQ